MTKSAAIAEFDDDELTGKILAAMREPVSDPEAAIQEARAHLLALASRTRRIETYARTVIAAVVGGSLTVAISVTAAAYHVGADQARDRERIEEVIRRLDRLDGRAEASGTERQVER